MPAPPGAARRGVHARADRSPEIAFQGSRDAILARWTETFDQLRGFRGGVLDDATAADVERRTGDFLAGREPLFTERLSAGRVVDGHGDMLADDTFCLDDGPRVLDCLEFSDRLRWLDGLDDAAFLAMDLEHLGAPELGRRFLDWYAEFAADPRRSRCGTNTSPTVPTCGRRSAASATPSNRTPPRPPR